MTRRTRSRSRILLLAVLSLTPLGCLLAPRVAFAASSVDKLQEFGLDQVQVTDQYQQNLFTKDVTYLITTLDSNRLLAGFQAVSAGTNPTNLYGGWENSNIRGHTMGHWMSAVAHAYQQAMGSDTTLAGQIKTKLDDVISKLKSYQLSSGFLFATPMSQFDDFDAGTGSTWVPYYTMHKILANIKTNLVQTAGQLQFNLKNTDSDSKLTFIPHYSRYQDRYGIYWKLAGTAGGTVPDAGVCPAGTGGSSGAGGATGGGAGGSTGSGGTTGGTGKGGAGGAGPGGATASSGGSSSNGGGAGAQGSGGRTGGGGAVAGGAQGSGGATSGSGGNANGGADRSGGGAAGRNSGASGGSAGQTSTGCSCNVGSTASTEHWTIGLLLGLGLLVRRRNRRG